MTHPGTNVNLSIPINPIVLRNFVNQGRWVMTGSKNTPIMTYDMCFQTMFAISDVKIFEAAVGGIKVLAGGGEASTTPREKQLDSAI